MDELPTIVRNRVPETREDARVRRTRRQLIGALFALVKERGYLGLTVAEMIERAGVARSTFYKHYRSKDDPLLNSFEGLLRMVDELLVGSGRPFPVCELFEHVAGALSFHQALKRGHRLERLYARGVDVVTGLIVTQGGPAMAEDERLRAWMFAGAMFALLAWWVEAGRSQAPEEMERVLLGASPGGEGV